MPGFKGVWQGYDIQIDERGDLHLYVGVKPPEPCPRLKLGRRPSPHRRIIDRMVADYVSKGGSSPGPEADAFVVTVIEQCRAEGVPRLPDPSTVKKILRDAIRRRPTPG
jgi:hypothetical protein